MEESILFSSAEVYLLDVCEIESIHWASRVEVICTPHACAGVVTRLKQTVDRILLTNDTFRLIIVIADAVFLTFLGQYQQQLRLLLTDLL